MLEKVALYAIIRGKVQGVFFRAFTVEKAKPLGLAGFVRNLPSGKEVEIKAEGNKKDLEVFIEYLKNGPPGAIVENINATWSEFSGDYNDFVIKD